SGVRLSLLGSALSADFITQGQSLIFSGPSGTGKTHLAIAIAYRAIQNGFDALFTTATALIEDLSATTRAGKLRPVLPTYTHPALDLTPASEPPSPGPARILRKRGATRSLEPPATGRSSPTRRDAACGTGRVARG